MRYSSITDTTNPAIFTESYGRIHHFRIPESDVSLLHEEINMKLNNGSRTGLNDPINVLDQGNLLFFSGQGF